MLPSPAMERAALFCLLLSAAACSSDRGTRTEIKMEWFFANGADCSTNAVVNIQVRANRTGEDAIVQRAPCPDGSLDFPPEGERIEEGAWTIEAQALDAVGATCFEPATQISS